MKSNNIALVTKFAARSLTGEQVEKLLEVLSKAPANILILQGNYKESMEYAGQIADVFRKAKWNVEVAEYPDGLINIGLVISKVGNATFGVDHALKNAGMEFNFTGSADKRVSLRVGLNTVVLDSRIL